MDSKRLFSHEAKLDTCYNRHIIKKLSVRTPGRVMLFFNLKDIRGLIISNPSASTLTIY